MADLIVPKGDYGFYLYFTVLDADGEPYDLTDYTVKLKVWKPGFPSVLTVDGGCDIIVAASGTCKRLVASGDFDTADTFSFELELTKENVVESTAAKSLLVAESG